MSYPRRNAVTQRFTLGAPRNILVTSDGTTVLFCRSRAADDPVNCLWSIDTATGEERLLVDPVELLDGGGEMTAAERARRERAREAGGGIVTYAAHSDHHLIAFALNGRLFLTNHVSGDTRELDAVAGAYDPRISPDGTKVAYHAKAGLHVTQISSDTSDHDTSDRDTRDRDTRVGGTVVIATDPDQNPNVSWGAAEFVAAEEMGRSRGFWWSPDSDALLVARVDTSDVETWHISEPVMPNQQPRAIPYPAAGTANADVTLFVIGLDGTSTKVDWRLISGTTVDETTTDESTVENAADGDTVEFEYLANASWTSGSGITLTVQTRDQRTLALLDVNPATGSVTQAHRQTDPGWVELVSGGHRRFKGRSITVADDHATDTRRIFIEDTPITPPDLQVRGVARVSADRITFTATTDATQVHVWQCALDGSQLTALTNTDGVHRFTGNETCWAITSANMDDTRSTTTVHRAAAPGQTITIDTITERPDLDYSVSFHRTTDRALNTALVVPADHDGSPLPVLLDPYGGPHALRVQHARSAFSASQWFADQGFAVVVTDGAGTPARGPAFEQQICGDLATQVLTDQIDALHDLADRHVGLLDLERVAVRGWSFGGYLAALAVLRRPDVFHAGVAGAPVTDWRLYDTHYTERYLGHPDTDPDHYDTTDLCAMAGSLERPLMLIHGLADDNVVAAHTFQLSRALLEAGRPHEVLPLSGVSHMTPQESVAENLLLLQVAFIRRSLGMHVA